MHIHIDWNGSYTLEEVKEKLTGGDDYGLYQIYGAHPVYGVDTLLYIGKASAQTLSIRISQHEKWLYNQDSENIRVYTGHLGGNEDISAEEWERQIDLAEKLLIYTHKPAYNSSNINSIPDIPIDTHVFNWCDYRSLMPEVSAFRHLSSDDEHFKTYRNFSK